ncbi:hypothetical protein RvY_19267-2 [Ramazzottius varieornatus]|uniref:SLC26A/SulP transporter domain-containing protein n=1 Tax=Ramazzottius varieornatus TaxID=947166 RepID=A0A1D1W9Y2_RAMVA|nr:hypothetical protein RvY_19267-2 [Ramazzottius varieornatus]
MLHVSRAQKDSDSGESRPIQRSSLRFGRNISVSRPIFSQAKFDSAQEFGEHGLPATPWEKVKRSTRRQIEVIKEWHPEWKRLTLGFFLSTFPILGWLRHYDVKQNLLKDVIAGFTVGIMNIPQGMAYALLASMPAVFGLYTSFFPLLIYTLMATSRHVSFGKFGCGKQPKLPSESSNKFCHSVLQGHLLWSVSWPAKSSQNMEEPLAVPPRSAI